MRYARRCALHCRSVVVAVTAGGPRLECGVGVVAGSVAAPAKGGQTRRRPMARTPVPRPRPPRPVREPAGPCNAVPGARGAAYAHGVLCRCCCPGIISY